MTDLSTGPISVDAAMKKGRRQLFFIPLAFMFGLIISSTLIICTMQDGSNWIPICGFGGFFLAFTLPFVYYSLMLPRWRIWAFCNVRNVHELKHRAILGQILPKDKSFLWRLEIKTACQKEQIKELEQRFNIPDAFIDDPTIPYETAYNYSKAENAFYLLLTIATMSAGVVFLAQRQLYIGLLMLVSTLIFGPMTYKRLKTTTPPLIISNDGITTIENGFHAWREIANEQIFFVSAGNASYYGLSYDVANTTIKYSLKELTGLSSYKIDHVLRTYRGRYEAGKTR